MDLGYVVARKFILLVASYRRGVNLIWSRGKLGTEMVRTWYGVDTVDENM